MIDFAARILLVYFLMLVSGIQAQPTFLKTYGNNNSGYGTSLVQTDDDGFVVTSILSDNIGIKAVLFKTDRNGEQEWVRSYGADLTNVPVKVVKSGEGGFYLLLASWTNFSPGNFHSVLLKLDSLGNEIWNRSFSLTQSDYSIDIDVEGDHLYVVCTSTYNTGGYPGVLVHKIDTAGSRIWSQEFTGPYGFSPVDAALDGSGRLAILGKTNSYGIGIPINDNNFLLLIDSAGNQLNTTITGQFYSCEPHSLIWQNGQWVIATLGYTLSSEYDILIQRLDSLGNFIESKRYDATSTPYHWEVARDIIPLSNGGLLIAGDIGSFDERNVMLAKLNSSGDVVYSNQYPVSPMFTNYAFEVVQTKDAGFAFTGDMRPPTSFRDAFIIKTDGSLEMPCYTSPISFVVLPDTVEVSYVTVNAAEVFPAVDTLMLESDIPLFPRKVICEKIPPIAQFSSSLDSICPQTCYSYHNTSLNQVDTWEWYFPDGEPDYYFGENPPPVCYTGPGTHQVLLETRNADGFSRYSYFVTISNTKCDTLFIPNVITPNGDGKNDIFNIVGLSDRFKLQIYNRWGKMLYETENENKLWNPKEVTEGVYYYLLHLYSQEGNENYRGTVTVLKDK